MDVNVGICTANILQSTTFVQHMHTHKRGALINTIVSLQKYPEYNIIAMCPYFKNNFRVSPLRDSTALSTDISKLMISIICIMDVYLGNAFPFRHQIARLSNCQYKKGHTTCIMCMNLWIGASIKNSRYIGSYWELSNCLLT